MSQKITRKEISLLRSAYAEVENRNAKAPYLSLNRINEPNAKRFAKVRNNLQIGANADMQIANIKKNALLQQKNNLIEIIVEDMQNLNRDVEFEDLKEIMNYYQLDLNDLQKRALDVLHSYGNKTAKRTEYEVLFDNLMKIDKRFLVFAPKAMIEENITRFSKFSDDELVDAYNYFLIKGYIQDEIFETKLAKYFKQECQLMR